MAGNDVDQGVARAEAPGSHPSGHAASGVDGAPRVDPSRIERRRQFLLKYYARERVQFVDRSGTWTLASFLKEIGEARA